MKEPFNETRHFGTGSSLAAEVRPSRASGHLTTYQKQAELRFSSKGLAGKEQHGRQVAD